jgi:hypothetical protein
MAKKAATAQVAVKAQTGTTLQVSDGEDWRDQGYGSVKTPPAMN